MLVFARWIDDVLGITYLGIPSLLATLLIATQARSLTLDQCTHICYGGEADHVDLGGGCAIADPKRGRRRILVSLIAKPVVCWTSAPLRRTCTPPGQILMVLITR